MNYPAIIRLSELNGVNGFRIDGLKLGDNFGYSVASAGDVSGDGIDDIIIGARYSESPGGRSNGQAYVVFGTTSGFGSAFDLSSLNGTNGFRIFGVSRDHQSGFDVAGAGDVNGDGFDDVLVGAPGAGFLEGASSVLFGRATGFAASISLGSLDGTNGFAFVGDEEYSFTGGALASAGDVNGDGFDDFIVGHRSIPICFGCPGGDRDDPGKTYLIFGRAAGFDASMDPSSLDGSNGFRLDGIDPNDSSGFSVASAGDVNGDGFDDIIIGAPSAASGAGESYVVFGKAFGFDAVFDLASLDGTNGFRLDGMHFSDTSGVSVSSAGDVNGDGFDDIIIGASDGIRRDDGDPGQAYVVFGQSAGFDPSIDLATLDGTNGFRIDGERIGSRTGFSVASAGDMNGDGFDDIIIGAFGAYSEGGRSYVVFGKATGFAATIELDTLNGRDGFRIAGVSSDDESGRSVAAAGDVNNDGFDDILIGAPRADGSAVASSGVSYVVFGIAPDTAVTRIGTIADQSLSGGAFDDALEGRNGDDVLTGNAGADQLLGEDGNDQIFSGNDADFASGGDGNDTIFGGSGDDVLDGGDGDDLITGGVDSDELVGGNGNDTIDGGHGNDNLIGGDGDDILNSGAGNDLLIGGAGVDMLRGRTGDDVYRVDDITDTVEELVAEGIDTIRASLDYILTANVERLELIGSAQIGIGNELANTVFGNASANILVGLGGNDVLLGGIGNDVLDGGAGFDAASYENSLSAVTVRLSASGDQNTGGDGIDRLADIEALIGSGFNDTLTGSAVDNDLQGRAGNDVVSGLAGVDTLNGNDGDDTLNGNDGNDTLLGGNGADRLFGGNQDDMLNGLAGNDVLNGQSGADTMRGGDGDDIYYVNMAGDVVVEGVNDDGVDTVYAMIDYVLGANVERLQLTGAARVGTGNALANTIFGTDAGDTLLGLDGNDVLRGNGARDLIHGGAGADTLDGGEGRDVLTGGADRDSFVFRDGDTVGSRQLADVITDFDQGANERIQLSLVDADSATGGNQDFEWIGNAAFGNVAGQLRYATQAGDTFVEGDLNGDGVADYTIRLTGLHTLDASDFTGVADVFP